MVGKMTRRSLSGAAAAAFAAGMLAMSGCGPAVPEAFVVQPAPPGAPAYVVTEVRLTRSNAAALVLAANNSTIARAQVARARAANPQVRAFADRVLAESQTAELLITAALAEYDITPKPEATAFQLDTYTKKTVAMLQGARGLQVDRVFLESEIANDRWLIGTLNSVIPSIPDSDVQRELRGVRNALTARLMEAEQLEAMVLQSWPRS